MSTMLHRIDNETVRDFEFRSTTQDQCPALMRYGEQAYRPSEGNRSAVQFEYACTMGPQPHDIHVFAVLMPGTDQAVMVLWGASDEVFRIQEELHESNAAEARVRG